MASAAVMVGLDARAKPVALPLICAHCGQRLTSAQTRFCCRGCETVSLLLQTNGLGRYYDLREGPQPPAAPVTPGELPCAIDGRVSLGIEGVHCTACVWLCEELFRQQPGAIAIEVRAARGQLDLQVSEDFSLPHYAKTLADFGYRLGVPHHSAAPASRELLFRIGVCAALALNSMAISFAFYFGLSSEELLLYNALGVINAALATAAVVAGGSVFFRSAWASLRARLLHLDVPIALGIALAYAASLAACVLRGPSFAYFDSVIGFITLMLLGKYLPQRMLEWNAAQLSGDRTFEGLRQRRRSGAMIEQVPIDAILSGDELLLAPGDLATVDIVLAGPGVFRLDWLSGEAGPVDFAAGALLPAGAFNADERVIAGRAHTSGKASSLHTLLPTPTRLKSDSYDRFVPRFAKIYVASVLALAAAVFIFWARHSLDRAFLSTVAVLVVSCPCAIGLATPVAYEIIVSRLRQAGVFLHHPSVLDRLAEVRAVAFDKTGTITGDVTELEGNPPPLAARDRSILATMASLSNHPYAKGIARALVGVAHTSGLHIEERPGVGLFASGNYFLGRALSGHTVFSHAGRTLAEFRFAEKAHDDAQTELSRLRQTGYSVAVLSGDQKERVLALAKGLGLPAAACLAQLSPEDKAKWVKDTGHVLMVGDGVNDVAAFEVALVSAAPATDRPCVPTRADFHYTGSRLAPVASALAAGRRFRHIVIGNYAFAFVYNACVLSLAASAHMTPLIAAVVMPASSIAIVGGNALAARRVR